jgi:D-glutamate cyclase
MLTHSTHIQESLDKIAQLQAIYALDVGRGISPLVKLTQGELLGAASSIVNHSCPHVVIITGFFLPHTNPPVAETDGLIGSVQLAASLIRNGVSVRIVTDSYCFPAVKSAAIAAGVPRNVEFDIVPVVPSTHDEVITPILETWKCLATPITHVISIERPGPGYDGIIRNMRGQDITAHTAPLHLLFNLTDVISIGIGDGGNELGMGKIPREVISNSIRYGERIACVISCDYLLVCGVSNWGADALLCACALLKPEWKSIIKQQLKPEVEFKILQTVVNNNLAADGVTGEAALTVDNLPWEFHAKVLNKINEFL